jgi:hypothetical protein
MNTWRARCSMLALITVIMLAHASATASMPNTPAAMLVFHGSAALLDWLLLLLTPYVLVKRVSRQTQWLLLASIGGNAAGWALYMAYAPPGIYNWFMWLLTVAQWVALILPDRPDADNPWNNLVRHRSSIGGSDHY